MERIFYIAKEDESGGDIVKLSFDILVHELRQFVISSHTTGESRLDITDFKFFDISISCFSDETVYIFLEKDFGHFHMLPSGGNVICIASDVSAEEPELKRLNYMLVGQVAVGRVANELVDIFEKYNILEREFNNAIIHGKPLKKILDILAVSLNIPLNMIDINHCTLAYSESVQPEGDLLWDVIKDGYGSKYYNVVERSIPKLQEMDVTQKDLYEGISNISGRYIRVYLLRKNGKAIATFGVHKLDHVYESYDSATIKVLDYFVGIMQSQMCMLSGIKVGRGKLHETLLLKVLDKKTESEDEMRDIQESLRFKEEEEYLLGMIFHASEIVQTENSFFLMDYLEATLPYSKCVMHNGRIVFLYPLFSGKNPLQHLQINLAAFLKRHKCYCVLSGQFQKLEALPDIECLLADVNRFIRKEDEDHNVYFFYQFALDYAIRLLYERTKQMNYLHPVIELITEYDRQNGTNYFDTFACYVFNNGNMTKTSAQLFMHRNSLLYRINKIEEITGINMNEKLLQEDLSFYIMCSRYWKEHRNGDINE